MIPVLAVLLFALAAASLGYSFGAHRAKREAARQFGAGWAARAAVAQAHDNKGA